MAHQAVVDNGKPPEGIREFIDWLIDEAHHFSLTTPGMPDP
ncbi:hypothetical protein [Salinicola halophyticus]